MRHQHKAERIKEHIYEKENTRSHRRHGACRLLMQ